MMNGAQSECTQTSIQKYRVNFSLVEAMDQRKRIVFEDQHR